MEKNIETTIKNKVLKYMLQKIDYGNDDFYYISLIDGNKVKASFLNGCYAFKITLDKKNVGKFMELLSEVTENCILTVENSEYIKEYRDRDFGFYHDIKLEHYIIISSEEILEVLSEEAPIFIEL